MAQIRFTPTAGGMGGKLTEIPVFPGTSFIVSPESIGDARAACRSDDLATDWSELGGGVWVCNGQCAGELAYVLTVTPGYDTVDLDIVVTNESNRTWDHSLAFNHVGSRSSSIADFECARHWCGTGGELKRLTEVPRMFNPRPTVQYYSVEGAPPATEVPFVSIHDATPDVVLERWLAIEARDGNRLAAVASKPALFLFQNMEYCCIHSSPSFGVLQPSESGQAWTRIYLVQATLAEWHTRMLLDMGP
jgi:hypothetical protein